MGIEQAWFTGVEVSSLLLLCAIKVPNSSVKELYQAQVLPAQKRGLIL